MTEPTSPASDAAPDAAALPRDTRRALPMALLRAREAVMVRYRPMLAAHDINEQQWRVLRVLDEGGQMDAAEVAARAAILAPSLTRMIRAMTDRGLITRRKDRADGRRVLLALAPAGAALIARVSPEGQKISRSLAARYGEERLAELLALLEALTELREG
jgi:homoprotocatechuate degradation regulator HpaR